MAKLPLTTEQRDALDEQQRNSALGGLARCIAQKGYAATTVGEVTAAGRISKSTFYAHFADKEEAFLALFTLTTDNVLRVIEQTAQETTGKHWRERLEKVIDSYLGALAADPELARCLLVETQAVSARAFDLRRQAIDRYVDLFMRLAEDVTRGDDGLRPLTPELALAVLAGIDELMLRQIGSDGAASLREVTPAATRLATSIVSAEPDR